MNLTEFLLARIVEDEAVARSLLADLERQVAAGDYAPDERGPFTQSRMLAAQLWAYYDGQTQDRNFARGQAVARLADPARVLAECEAKRRMLKDLDRALLALDGVAGGSARLALWSYVENARRALAQVYADHPDFDPAWRL